MRIIIITIIFLVFLFLHFGKCIAEPTKEYLSKTTIDTLVQQSFVNLNASTGTEVPHADSRHAQAITEAKNTINKLKAIAQGDRNEKYILWKVGELESQVFLEERDIVLKNMEKNRKNENQHIESFNKELAEKRPDFFMLTTLCNEMDRANSSKAREMRESVDQRETMVSREVLALMEKALLIGDQGVLHNEFCYCYKNRSALKISPEKFAYFEQKIPAQAEALDKKALIDRELTIAAPFLVHNKLGILHKSIADIQANFYQISANLPLLDRTTLNTKINALNKLVCKKEDSLVYLCTAILKTHGDNAALDFVDGVLKPCGVAEAKIAQVNMQILHKEAVSSIQKETAISQDVGKLSDTLQSSGAAIDLGDVRLLAKKKAQARSDSMRAFEEQKFQANKIEQAHRSSIQQETKRREQMAERLDNEKQANIHATSIYTLIGENSGLEAQNIFIKEQKFLETYLSAEAFAQLKALVLQPQEKGGDQANEPNHAKAKQVTAQIYSFIENNNAAAAYNRFIQVRKPLEKYLDKEAFAMLETTVKQAYEAGSANSAK